MLLSCFAYIYLVKPRWMNYPHHLYLSLAKTLEQRGFMMSRKSILHLPKTHPYSHNCGMR